ARTAPDMRAASSLPPGANSEDRADAAGDIEEDERERLLLRRQRGPTEAVIRIGDRDVGSPRDVHVREDDLAAAIGERGLVRRRELEHLRRVRARLRVDPALG